MDFDVRKFYFLSPTKNSTRSWTVLCVSKIIGEDIERVGLSQMNRLTHQMYLCTPFLSRLWSNGETTFAQRLKCSFHTDFGRYLKSIPAGNVWNKSATSFSAISKRGWSFSEYHKNDLGSWITVIVVRGRCHSPRSACCRDGCMLRCFGWWCCLWRILNSRAWPPWRRKNVEWSLGPASMILRYTTGSQ